MLSKKAIVVHSGGMDSSICLKIAINKYGAENILSLSFNYDQRHSLELERANEICNAWGVDHVILPIQALSQITENAITNSSLSIGDGSTTLVVGRNGLMARLAAIHADALSADTIYMGVIEVEEANSGYRDCSRAYMDLMEEILRIDLDSKTFSIVTPLVRMTKLETMNLADQLGVLPFLLEKTISCYRGQPNWGCKDCPACQLRNEAIEEYLLSHPRFKLPQEYL